MIFERTIRQIGLDNFEKLKNTTVLILGIGGVGGNAVEALVRGGIGRVIIVDDDSVNSTNINRQLIALHSTLEQPKVEAMKQRIKDINPECEVIAYHTFYNIDTKKEILNHNIDFICDCIDTVTFKIDVIKDALQSNIPIISSMGMGNKFHPERIEIEDLYETSYDPIARVIRSRLRRQKIEGSLKVVYSKEKPIITDSTVTSPTSNSYVPSVAGIIMASYVINTIIEKT